MQLRIRQWNESENKNELLAVQNLKDSDVSETFKILHFMKQNEIPLHITKGVADNDDYEEYFIYEINMEFDEGCDEERILPCISVDCK
jgi:hypothetical protein